MYSRAFLLSISTAAAYPEARAWSISWLPRRLFLPEGLGSVPGPMVGRSCAHEDRQQGRPKSRTPASGAVRSNWGGSPSEEEPSGRSLRTLSRGDQMQRSLEKMQSDVPADRQGPIFFTRPPSFAISEAPAGENLSCP